MMPALWFVHGWGFDASVFDGLADALSGSLKEASAGASADVSAGARADASADRVPFGPQSRYDAGYVGAASKAPPAQPFIAVVHSFGMMRVLKDLPAHCLGIVCLNGFARFSAAPDFAEGTPLRLIDRMLQRLRQDPIGVVNTFRARCGAAPYPATTALDVDALFADLSALRDDDARAALAACAVPVVALAAEDDPIVPPAMTAMTFAGRAATPLAVLANGGHLLPMTRPADCADAVRRMVGERLTLPDRSLPATPPVAIVNDSLPPGSGS